MVEFAQCGIADILPVGLVFHQGLFRIEVDCDRQFFQGSPLVHVLYNAFEMGDRVWVLLLEIIKISERFNRLMPNLSCHGIPVALNDCQIRTPVALAHLQVHGNTSIIGIIP